LALSVALVAGGCNKDNGKNGTLAQDSTLTRDLQMANADTAAQPQLKDVPPAETAAAAAPAETARRPEPARTKPRTRAPSSSMPAPAAPTTTPSGNSVSTSSSGTEAALGTVPAGTSISLTSNDRICTNTNKPGDRFTATVTNAVVGSNGAVIPAGAKALIQVTELKRSENATSPIQMTFSVLSLSFNGKTYPVTASIDHVDVDKVRNSSRANYATKVAGGAIFGATLGLVFGHNTTSTVFGAAGGAAAGTAVAMGTANYEGCVPQGGNISIKLTEPATVQ
jgi:hypothetical protein